MMLLAFIVVLFAGLAFMFFAILRGQERICKTLREEHARILDRLERLEQSAPSCQPREPEETDRAADTLPDTAPALAMGSVAASGPSYRPLETSGQGLPDRLDMASTVRRERSIEKENGMPDLKL